MQMERYMQDRKNLNLADKMIYRLMAYGWLASSIVFSQWFDMSEFAIEPYDETPLGRNKMRIVCELHKNSYTKNDPISYRMNIRLTNIASLVYTNCIFIFQCKKTMILRRRFFNKWKKNFIEFSKKEPNMFETIFSIKFFEFFLWMMTFWISCT